MWLDCKYGKYGGFRQPQLKINNTASRLQPQAVTDKNMPLDCGWIANMASAGNIQAATRRVTALNFTVLVLLQAAARRGWIFISCSRYSQKPSPVSAYLRKMSRLILPEKVLGRLCTNSISRGYLYGAVMLLQCC